MFFQKTVPVNQQCFFRTQSQCDVRTIHAHIMKNNKKKNPEFLQKSIFIKMNLDRSEGFNNLKTTDTQMDAMISFKHLICLFLKKKQKKGQLEFYRQCQNYQ